MPDNNDSQPIETPEGTEISAAPVGDPTLDTGASHLNRMMTYNFMEFASYVIKDRAIPDIDDGLKPVQRRILHTLRKVDDGKYHKVANVVGESMKYHPHGDTSIYGALVNLANKEFFIDKQGNFGNILTGDNASAARYIECRLTPLAREVLFNKETTLFVDSYDGRNQEPVALPSKVPVLLMQGAEGIAVGMATKVLPHNFNELLKAQIDILRGKRIELFPDFLQGGIMDVSQYDNGNGKVKVRARIEKMNKNTLIIKEVPAGTTTESLMSSIEDATKNGKIKLSSINDYTAENVEIELKVSRGVDADQTLEALYAFTSCETSLSSNITIIKNNRPAIMTVTEVLHHNTQRLVDYLRWELEIEEAKLNERYHDKTLEQIFIENRIYKRIEDCTEEEAVYEAVFSGLEPFKDRFRREVTREDIDRLLRIPIRRISLFDINKNKKELDDILKALEEVRYNLAHLKDYTIKFIKDLLKRYGKDYPRRTEIKQIKHIDAKHIALSNTKIGLDRKGGYIGTSVSGADSIKCTEFDRIIVLHKDGKFKVMNIPDKLFVGRFSEAFIVNKEQVYSVIYKENKSNLFYHKRCRIDKFIVDKEYKLCPDKCKIELFETNYSIVLDCELEDSSRSKGQTAELIFDDIPIRSASAKGFKTANRPITKFIKKKRGTEKPPEDAEAKEEVATEEAEDAKKKVRGWKSKTPIRFTPPEAVVEEEVIEVDDSQTKKPLFLNTSKEEVETREVPAPEAISEPEATEEAAESKEDAVAEKTLEEETNETAETDTQDDAPEEKTTEKNKLEVEVTIEPVPEETQEEKPQESNSDENDEDNNEEVKQAELDLPQEKGARRYLIDEDNPFMLEP